MTTKITEQNVSNFANLGVQWQAVHVADGSTALAVTAGKGYFIDTTSATQTVNLPANASSTAGDTIILKDYARKWGTNKITMGSNTFDGATATPEFDTEGQTVTLVHMGTTKGWSLINEDTTSTLGSLFVAATGGTVATSGNFKIHAFTGDGNFVVSCAGNSGGSNTVSYLVVAGGGGGTGDHGGGGGAGGYRESSGTGSGAYGTNPLSNGVSDLTVTAQTYPISVGGGGSGVATPPGGQAGGNGSNSVFSTITSAGGGGGGRGPGSTPGANGGSGGGVLHPSAPLAGAGNTPPVSPPQGSPGNYQTNAQAAGGGGGAGGPSSALSDQNGKVGMYSAMLHGTPVASSYGTTGPQPNTRYFSGGGGGGSESSASSGTGGSGGGANGGGNTACTPGSAATANTGGGGGGASGPGGSHSGGNGGTGIVIIRYKFQ